MRRKTDVDWALLFCLVELFRSISPFRFNRCSIIESQMANARNSSRIRAHLHVQVIVIMVFRVISFEIIIDIGK